VFRYATRESSSGFASFLSEDSARNTSVVYFIVTDGVVTRFWADRAREHTLLGSEVDKPQGEKSER
jgi:hypothetical protein